MRKLTLLSVTLALLPGAVASAAGPSRDRILYVGIQLNDRPGIVSLAASGSARVNLTSSLDDESPTVSRDGKKVAFVRVLNRMRSIWVMNVDGSDKRRLTAGGDPSWSPAGTAIAYDVSTPRAAGIYLIDVATGVTKELVAGGQVPLWSPDGRNIAYDIPPNGAQPPRLEVVRPDGSERHVLAELAWPAAWSPDGTRLVFDQGLSPTSLDIINVDGTGQRVLADEGLVAPVPGPVTWSPDGGKISFTFGSVPQKTEIVSPSGGTPLLVGNGIAGAWSHDSKQLTLLYDNRIYLATFPADQSSGVAPKLTLVPSQDRKGVVGTPVTATRLAEVAWVGPDRLLISQRPTTSPKIMTARSDGRDVRQVTHGTARDSSPDWSPDGSNVVFVRADQLWIISASGAQRPRLIADPGHRDALPAWSPDGKKIVFIRDTGTLAVIDADGRRLRTLPSAGNGTGFPRWSPDGKQIAYIGPQGIYIVNANGAGAHLIARRGIYPDWSPDGKRIAFSRGFNCPSSECRSDYPDFTYKLFTVRPDGTGSRELPNSRMLIAPRYSPDGTQIIATTYLAPAGTVTILNLRSFHIRTVNLRYAGDLQGQPVAWQPPPR